MQNTNPDTTIEMFPLGSLGQVASDLDLARVDGTPDEVRRGSGAGDAEPTQRRVPSDVSGEDDATRPRGGVSAARGEADGAAGGGTRNVPSFCGPVHTPRGKWTCDTFAWLNIGTRTFLNLPGPSNITNSAN